MPRFSPFAIINVRHTNSEIKGQYKRFKTYRELKKNLTSLINESTDKQVHVLRSLRGEWGEWNEIWKLVDGKPKIISESWS